MSGGVTNLLTFALVAVLLLATTPSRVLAASAHAGRGEETHDTATSDHHRRSINWFRFGKETPPLIANVINTAVVLFILWYFARKPIGRYFEERRRKIKQAMEEADRLETEAREHFKLISQKLEKFEEEVQQMKKELLAMAVLENERAIAAAREQAETIREGALKLVEQEKEAMLDRLRAEIAEAVLQRAGEIVKERIGRHQHDRMVMEMIETFTERR